MIVTLIAVSYRAAQEMGFLLKDVNLFPYLILLAWGLFLYFIFAGRRANLIYRRVYNSWGKRRRVMAYLIVISIGAVIGGGTAGALWKLFELHRQQMQKLQVTEARTEPHTQTSNATPTPSPTPVPSPKEAVAVPEEKKAENAPSSTPRTATPRTRTQRRKASPPDDGEDILLGRKKGPKVN